MRLGVSAPATARTATWLRNCARARVTSCWMSALAAAFSRSPSAFAAARAASTICASRFSACAMISKTLRGTIYGDGRGWLLKRRNETERVNPSVRAVLRLK